MNKEIVNLLNVPHIRKQILDFLEIEGLIEPSEYKRLGDIVLTAKAKKLLKEERLKALPIDFVKKYNDLWPPEKRVIPSVIQKAYVTMVNAFGEVSQEEIVAAANQHIEEEGNVYCGMADFFFMKDGKSRCMNHIMRLRSTDKIPAVSGQGNFNVDI